MDIGKNPFIHNMPIAHALWYAKNKEWSVFPVKPGEKIPLTEHGFKDSSLDINQIQAWWGKWPSAGIGIDCEKSKLIVLDIDPRHGGDVSFEGLKEDYDFPETVECQTGGGGLHYYFQRSENNKDLKNITGLLPGIDIKIDGYVIAPPSRHPSGNYYVYEASGQPDNQPIAGLPGWLLNLLKEYGTVKPKSPETAVSIPEGRRHDYLKKMAGKLRHAGFQKEEIYNSLLGINQTRCIPPSPEKEIRRLAEDFEKYPTAEEKEIKIYTCEDVLNFKKPEYLIHSMMFQGTINLLCGKPGEGKSLLALSIARAVASGKDLWKTYEIAKAGSVLLFDNENPESFLLERYQKMNIKNLPIFLLHFQDIMLDDSRSYEKINEIISKYNPSLMIFDSLIRFHSAEEDTAGEMAVIFKNLRGISNQGIAILLLHHYRKGSGDIRDQARGSSDIVAAIDTEFSLMKKEDMIIFRSVKSRVEPFEPIRITLEASENTLEIVYIGEVKQKAEEAKNIIKEILSGAEKGFKDIVEYFENEGIEIGQSNIRKALKNLEYEGIIHTSKAVHNKKMYRLS